MLSSFGSVITSVLAVGALCTSLDISEGAFATGISLLETDKTWLEISSEDEDCASLVVTIEDDALEACVDGIIFPGRTKGVVLAGSFDVTVPEEEDALAFPLVSTVSVVAGPLNMENKDFLGVS